MHLTAYCYYIPSKVWTKCSLWATAKDQPLGTSAGADSQQNILRNVERAGSLALYVE